MKAAILSVGSELVLGQTVDTNSAWLSRRLAEVGVPAACHVTIGDEPGPLAAEIRRACDTADLVIITGGLGPTEDDLTRQALAEVMGVELELREPFLESIRCFFAQRGREMPATNAIQAHFPKGSTAIENTCGTAPGIEARIGNATVFAVPGVPREMRVMYELAILPTIRAAGATGVILSTDLWCHGAGESTIGGEIRDLMARGTNPAVGTTAQHGIIGVRIAARADTVEASQAMLDATAAEVRRRLGTLVFGSNEETLWSVVGRLLSDTKATVATAESCTGGLIAKCLTDVPGSSAYMIDGVVTYANAAKTRLLGVPEEMIAAHGAVSPQVAEAMAINCRERSGTDYSISVTGIAGPTGGTSEKPVGLVYIGIASAAGCDVHEHRYGDMLTREEIRDRTAKAALDHLRLKLLEQSPGGNNM